MERLLTSNKCIAWRIVFSAFFTALLIVSYLTILSTVGTTRLVLLCILGSAIAIGLGHLYAGTFLSIIRNHIYKETKKRGKNIDDMYIDPLAVPGWIVGIVERAFFGTLIAFEIGAAAAGMVTWIFVKMATDWNRFSFKANDDYGPRSLAFASLLAGVISLFLSVIGGFVCLQALKVVKTCL